MQDWQSRATVLLFVLAASVVCCLSAGATHERVHTAGRVSVSLREGCQSFVRKNPFGRFNLGLRGGVEIAEEDDDMDIGTMAETLKSAVSALEADPTLLHKSELGFFRRYLKGLGASIPRLPSSSNSKSDEAMPDSPTHAKQDNTPEEEEEEEDQESMEDEGEQDIVPEEEADVETPPSMGDPSRELGEDDMDKAMELKGKAQEALADGNAESAVGLLTEAVELSVNANLLATRGMAFLAMRKPLATIRDANKALEINPDSAKAFRARGKAEAMLGRWLTAVSDLATAQSIDFDEGIADLQKQIQVHADRIHKREAKVRAKKAKEDQAKLKAEIQRRKEAAIQRKKEQDEEEERERKAAEEAGGMPGGGMPGGMGGMPGGMGGMPGGMGGMPGGMGGMEQLFSDPDVQKAMKNPKVMQAMMEMQTGGPAAMAKYANDPEVMNLIMKLQSKMGGMGGGGGGMPGGMGGMPGGMGGMPGGMGGMGGMPGGMGGMPEVD